MNNRKDGPYNSEETFSIDLLKPKYLLTWVGLFILFFVSKLPISVVHKLGDILGLIFLLVNKQRKKIALINLKLCFPKLKEQEINNLLKENFKNIGKGIFEMGIAWWSSKSRLQNLISNYSNKELLEKLTHDKQGLLVLIKHSTHLELDLRMIANICEMGGMYRPQKNLVINYFMRKSRNSYLNGVVSNSQSRKGILWIKRGLKFFYAADQDYGNKVSEYIPFFGHKAATVKLPGDLAASGLDIIFADVKRNKFGYAIHLHKFKQTSSREEFLIQMNEYYEKVISETPEEYLWVHRRFKNRPDDEDSFYPHWKRRKRRRERERNKTAKKRE